MGLGIFKDSKVERERERERARSSFQGFIWVLILAYIVNEIFLMEREEVGNEGLTKVSLGGLSDNF